MGSKDHVGFALDKFRIDFKILLLTSRVVWQLPYCCALRIKDKFTLKDENSVIAQKTMDRWVKFRSRQSISVA